MKKVKKTLSLLMAFVLVAGLAVAGTLAYLTDHDSAKNTFTVGDVSIDVYETIKHVDGAGNVKKEEVINQGEGVDGYGTTYTNIMPGDVMAKVVTVENTDKTSGAYVALSIKQDGYQTFNKYIDDVYENSPYNYGVDEMQKVINDIFFGDDWQLVYDKNNSSATDGYTTAYGMRYVSNKVENAVDQDGSKSYAGASGAPVLIAVDYTMTQVNEATGYKANMMNTWDEEKIKTHSYSSYYELDTDAQNRMWVYYLYMPAGTTYTLDLSVTCPTYITSENIAAFDDMVIDVHGTAIQADGFKSAKEAFEVLAQTLNYGYTEEAVTPDSDEDLDDALDSDTTDIVIEMNQNMTLEGGEIEHYGGEDTDTITIDGNGHTLTIDTNYIANLGTTNPDATLILKNMTVTSTKEDGTWDIHSITFQCSTVLENVTFEKAVRLNAVGKDVTMKGVTINEAGSDYYGLWISAGTNATLENCSIHADRGIKISDSEVSSPALTTLNVSNTSFDTNAKAAILVGSLKGADITLDNVNIENVTADTTNAVWVDEDYTGYSEQVTVTGGTKTDES